VSGVTRAYVALGSNLGDRLATLDAALRALDALPGVRVVASSSVYETEPWGGVEQPPYANAVVALDFEGNALSLLRSCKLIERALGRETGVRFGPRTLDLDLLLFGDEALDTPELTIPHPRMLEREFVVTPLLEIAPRAALPDGRPVTAERAIEGRIKRAMGRLPRLGDDSGATE
jgi:2-amino-4-hydroxy-6-hydroxymethyldihydropteridine diphosphokinase